VKPVRRRDDDVDALVGDPVAHLLADFLDVVGDDGAPRDDMGPPLDPFRQRAARLVVGQLAVSDTVSTATLSGRKGVCRPMPGMMVRL